MLPENTFKNLKKEKNTENYLNKILQHNVYYIIEYQKSIFIEMRLLIGQKRTFERDNYNKQKYMKAF